jgi:hypothetical protein
MKTILCTVMLYLSVYADSCQLLCECSDVVRCLIVSKLISETVKAIRAIPVLRAELQSRVL